jgi:hypothetical protein
LPQDELPPTVTQEKADAYPHVAAVAGWLYRTHQRHLFPLAAASMDWQQLDDLLRGVRRDLEAVYSDRPWLEAWAMLAARHTLGAKQGYAFADVRKVASYIAEDIGAKAARARKAEVATPPASSAAPVVQPDYTPSGGPLRPPAHVRAELARIAAAKAETQVTA